MDQTIRFLTTSDGVKLAFAESGSGPPLLKTANWLNHLEFDWQSPVWRHWFSTLSANHSLIRYDARGCGLSDWVQDDLSLERNVRDLECVVAASGQTRFALLALSQGAAVAIEFAVRHPEHVSHLVIHGGYAQGWARRDPESTPKAPRGGPGFRVRRCAAPRNDAVSEVTKRGARYCLRRRLPMKSRLPRGTPLWRKMS